VSDASRQLVFDLPFRTALGADDFIVAAGNEAAVRMIDSWPDWSAPALVLTGPEGSGKTHLAHVWQATSGAELLPATALDGLDPMTYSGRALVVEDADRGIGDAKVFFHLLNVARETGGSLLVTGRTAPADWGIALPDLASRLRAAPIARLDAVDEHLLRAVLVKLLGDRQLPASPATVNYLAKHLERTMAAALTAVATIDQLLWDKPGSGLTRTLASDVLARMGTAVPESADEE
jgi:chromosomal replication initiation ATPase DnaA